MDKQTAKHIRMTQEPVGKLICQLAVPCIVSMMITAIYNTADTFFVGQLDSNSATGAIGVAYTKLYTPLLPVKNEYEMWLGEKMDTHLYKSLKSSGKVDINEMGENPND